VGGGQSSQATVSGRQHDLPGVAFPQIADGIHTGGVGLALVIGHHKAVGIHSRTGRDQLVVGLKADENKNAVNGHLALFLGLNIFKGHAAHTVIVRLDFGNNGIPQDLDVAILFDALL
jgi:hypothetical protein